MEDRGLTVRERKTVERIAAWDAKRMLGGMKEYIPRKLTDQEWSEEREKIRQEWKRLGTRRVFPESCVYALLDPGSREIFYVGATGSKKKRRAQHRQAHANHNQSLCEKLQSIKKRGSTPLLVVLERAEKEQKWQREKQWIQFFTELSMPLLNLSPHVGGTKGRRGPYRRRK